MYMVFDSTDKCRVLLEKDEHDHKLKWLIPGMEIELSTTKKEQCVE